MRAAQAKSSTDRIGPASLFEAPGAGGRADQGARERDEGFTLLEVLVAMGVMVLLGGGLVALMSQGIALWNEAENSGRVYDQARAVLDLVARDLRSTIVRSEAAAADADVRFVCDRGPDGRQRLRFVRTISGETRDPILREGGRFLGVRAREAYDGRSDGREAREGLLAAPGGAMEVFYSTDPRPGEHWLWRGVRSPIGGTDSLFRDRNVEGETIRLAKTADDGEKEVEDPYKGVPFSKVATPITDGVLFLGFSFWGPTTNTWDPSAKPLLEAQSGKASGPLFWWDSTRALVHQEAERDEFAFRPRPISLNDASDDIFPEMVEITLVLREGEGPLGTRVNAPFDAKSKSFEISTALALADDPRNRFLLVGDEWIAVEAIEGRTVRVADGGRGVRDTRAVAHVPGDRVRMGVTFRRVVDVPGNLKSRFEPEEKRRGVRRGTISRGRR